MIAVYTRKGQPMNTDRRCEMNRYALMQAPAKDKNDFAPHATRCVRAYSLLSLYGASLAPDIPGLWVASVRLGQIGNLDRRNLFYGHQC